MPIVKKGGRFGVEIYLLYLLIGVFNAYGDIFPREGGGLDLSRKAANKGDVGKVFLGFQFGFCVENDVAQTNRSARPPLL